MRQADLKIRTSSVVDAKAVSHLLDASYRALLPEFYQQSVMAQILPLITKANPLLLASGRFYIVEAGRGIVVGCGGWSLRRPDPRQKNPNEGSIRHFGTHPDWLRKGVGGLILARCIEEAKARHLRALNCYSALGAESFYQAFGFEIVDTIEVPLTNRISFPARLMRNELS